MIYIGIDPGKKGGYAILFDNGDVFTHIWDDEEFIDDMSAVSKAGKCIACVEKVGAMPKQSPKSMFSFGQSYGFILGVLTTCGIPYQLVPPNVWKKDFSLIGKEKRESVIVARRLYPEVNMLATAKSRVPSDGISDALCLMTFAKRHF